MIAMPGGAPWRLLITPPADGATNMAIDWAIAQLQRELATPPTLRLYRWSPACLSLGAFQQLRSVVDLDACREVGLDMVRRPTGGRAILHDQELTYALVASADHPLVSGLVLESYRKISAALLRGLRLLGVDAALAPELPQDAEKSAACFDHPSAYEITAAGRKILGSAQTRKQGVLLQHGSLLLHAEHQLLRRCLILPEQLTASALSERSAGLDELLGQPVAFEQVAECLVEGFRQAWSVELVPGALTPEEQALAEALRREKFASWSWTSLR